MTDEERMGGYTPRRALRFYVPLLLQAFSQSLTYPLVGAIASRGSYGVDELTAFTQGQIVMFFIGAVGGGLVTTGMVFARSRLGYAAFKALNAWMMLGLVAIQLACAIGPSCACIRRRAARTLLPLAGAFVMSRSPIDSLLPGCFSHDQGFRFR